MTPLLRSLSLALLVTLAGCDLVGGEEGPQLTFTVADLRADDNGVVDRDGVSFDGPPSPVDTRNLLLGIYFNASDEPIPPFPYEVLPGGVRVKGFFMDGCGNGGIYGSIDRHEQGLVVVRVNHHSVEFPDSDVRIFCTDSPGLSFYTAELRALPGEEVRVRVAHGGDSINNRRPHPNLYAFDEVIRVPPAD